MRLRDVTLGLVVLGSMLAACAAGSKVPVTSQPLAAPASASPEEEVAVEVAVEGLRSEKGMVAVALFTSARGFPGDMGAAVRQATATPRGRAATLRFAGLRRGTYAFAVLHDENGNGKLDTGLFGIPSEGLGASNGAQGGFGPAKFEDARIELTADRRVEITIRYFP